jgi:DNA-binding MurR/RpiR family transcriptional regulator
MGAGDNIEKRITQAFERLSPKHKRLARYVLDNQYFMSYAPANQAGAQTGTSAATVVRFAQALGYAGYSDMQDALRAHRPQSLTAVERMQVQNGDLPPAAKKPNDIFAMDVCNIETTASSLNEEKLALAVQAILNAGKILVVGSGLSEGSVHFLTHSLKVLGFDARPIVSGGLPMAVDLALLKPGSLLIAISMWRYVRSTYDAVVMARQAGIPTIAITDSIVSPLADKADFAFEIATDSNWHSLSPTAVTSFINVLVAMLSIQIPERALESLRRVDAVYRDKDLVLATDLPG